MRRQHFQWTFLVLALVLMIYGGYSLIYSHVNHKDLPVLGLIFFIGGSILMIVYVVLTIISVFQYRKVAANNKVVEAKVEEVPKKEEKPEEEPEQEDEEEEEIEEPVTEKEDTRALRNDTVYVSESKRSAPRFEGGSGYVKKVGFGPVLRVNNEEVLDMRTNTYYRIEGNMVKQMGSGPVFEISGNKIRSAFGSYLYEISGSNVNKVFGGYYASISGGYLQTYDLQDKYELTDDFNLKQKLAIVALLFGTY